LGLTERTDQGIRNSDALRKPFTEVVFGCKKHTQVLRNRTASVLTRINDPHPVISIPNFVQESRVNVASPSHTYVLIVVRRKLPAHQGKCSWESTVHILKGVAACNQVIPFRLTIDPC